MTYHELASFLMREATTESPEIGEILLVNALKVLGEWGVIYNDALKYTSERQLREYMQARSEAGLGENITTAH